jgi:acetyl-CoA carboxylase carboxyl transferase subunit alpha
MREKKERLRDRLRRRRERAKKLKELKAARKARQAAARLGRKANGGAPPATIELVLESSDGQERPAAAAKGKLESIEEERRVNPTPPKDRGSRVQEKQRRREIDALERDVEELSRLSGPTPETAAEIDRIRNEVEELKREFYTNLGPWQRLLLARHPQRPYADDYIRFLFENFSEIHGDRHFADDSALITGMARFHGKPIMVIGNLKGRDMRQRLARNFGQAKPEGYRKALRAMRLAAKFNRPIFIFVDTPGAYPGVGAEERGQAEAIAYNLREIARLPVPIVVTITGEGGSGGALAIAVGDRVFMLENSIYSVISPEGCASIMWRDASKAEIAAEALKITARDLLEMKLVDEIVPEPEGGAHFDAEAAARLLEPFLTRALDELSALSPDQLLAQRYEKYRRMGQFFS